MFVATVWPHLASVATRAVSASRSAMRRCRSSRSRSAAFLRLERVCSASPQAIVSGWAGIAITRRLVALFPLLFLALALRRKFALTPQQIALPIVERAYDLNRLFPFPRPTCGAGGSLIGASSSRVARIRDRDWKVAMDGSAFDRLARSIGEEGSRRRLLEAAVAGILAGLGLTSWLGGEDAEAKSCEKTCNNKSSNAAKKKCKKKCKKQTPSGTGTIGLRQPCSTTADCEGILLCQPANSQNSCPSQATGTFCCVPSEVQDRCNDSCECCGINVICNGGFCVNA
jgi:hypothetical protein